MKTVTGALVAAAIAVSLAHPAPAGTRQRRDVALSHAMLVAGVVPNRTVAPFANPVPFNVTR